MRVETQRCRNTGVPSARTYLDVDLDGADWHNVEDGDHNEDGPDDDCPKVALPSPQAATATLLSMKMDKLFNMMLMRRNQSASFSTPPEKQCHFPVGGLVSLSLP